MVELNRKYVIAGSYAIEIWADMTAFQAVENILKNLLLLDIGNYYTQVRSMCLELT